MIHYTTWETPTYPNVSQFENLFSKKHLMPLNNFKHDIRKTEKGDYIITIYANYEPTYSGN